MSNVLVYSGPGVSASALSHTLRTLRRLLPSYDVQCINAQSLAVDPWMESTSLLVLPGGRDLPYVEKLSEQHTISVANVSSSVRALGARQCADQRIRQYVEQHGGAFIGICAGAYYASATCEFERGNAVMQVVGTRPALQFYPGTCSGTVFPGFVYESDQGARMVDVDVSTDTQAASLSKIWSTYYNGGGAFIDADKYESTSVLGRYVAEGAAQTASSQDPQHGIKQAYVGQAAIIHCRVGTGQAILYGTHPEFPVGVLERPARQTGAPEALPQDAAMMEALEQSRLVRFGRHLQLLGLEVNLPLVPGAEAAIGTAQQPNLTPVVLIGRQKEEVKGLLASLQQSMATAKDGTIAALAGTPISGHLFSISDTNDTIHFFDAAQAGSELAQLCAKADYTPYLSPVVARTSDEARAGQSDVAEMEVDLQKVPKYVVVATDVSSLDPRLVPHWDVAAFVQWIEASRNALASSVHESWTGGSVDSRAAATWGGANDALEARLADIHTYAHVVTSTQTMLDKNYKLLTNLASGFTSFATHQVSGRGRGRNAWISPLGCLQFSTLLRVPKPQQTFWHAGMGAIVFVQYLAGLAIVESVRCGALGAEYAAALGDKLRIKWPNDVYAHVGSANESEELAKTTVLHARKGTFAWRGKRYAKMAGVLVNSQFAGSELALVVGCGINTLNARPTTSLSDLIEAHNATLPEGAPHIAVVSQERYAGAIIATLERMWNTFVAAGGSFAPFVDAYRRAWLHSDQDTLLSDTQPPTRARIVGITSDYGLLRCVPITEGGVREAFADTYSPSSWGPSATPGPWIDLQPDGNSFDMLQNLIRRKE